jgi:hypothetical protein
MNKTLLALLGAPQYATLGNMDMGALMGGPLGPVQGADPGALQAQQPAAAPAKKPTAQGLSTADIAGLIGGWAANMKDMNDPTVKGGDDHVTEAVKGITERRAARADKDRRSQLAQLLYPNDPVKQAAYMSDPKAADTISERQDQDAYINSLPPEQQAEARLNPGKYAETQRARGKREIINARDGVYAVDPYNPDTPMLVHAVPPPAPTAPTGMVRGPDGKLTWAPGYLDAQGQLTGRRRDEVVSRPTPSRARPKASAAASVGVPGLGSGWTIGGGH